MGNGRGRWLRNPHDLPPALRDALTRCPTCGQEWPPEVRTETRTPCRPDARV